MISTTRVESLALSEVVMTLKCIVMVLQSMEIEVTLPITPTVYVDNIGGYFWQTTVLQMIEQNM